MYHRANWFNKGVLLKIKPYPDECGGNQTTGLNL